MLVIAYHTNDARYTEERNRFEKSLIKVGMPYQIEVIPPVDNWNDATAYKPIFLLGWRRRYRGALLYIDVDAVVHENCEQYFEQLQGDIGMFWAEGKRMLSGTIWLGDTPSCELLLARWCLSNALKRACGDNTGGGQRNLWELISELEDLGMEMVKLPGRYCYAFRRPEWYEGEPRIIEHLLASRENRDASRGTIDPLRRERIRELSNG